VLDCNQESLRYISKGTPRESASLICLGLASTRLGFLPFRHDAVAPPWFRTPAVIYDQYIHMCFTTVSLPDRPIGDNMEARSDK
jgi:hypothetical protein